MSLVFKRSLFFLLLLSITSCARAPASAAPVATREIAANPYLKLMWSMYDPAATLVAGTERIVVQGPRGLSAVDTWSNVPAWTDNAASSGKLFIDGSTLYRSIYNGLEAYDLQSGMLLWQTHSLASGNARAISADSSHIFLTDQSGRLLVLDSTGRFIRAVAAPPGATPISLEGNNLIYADQGGLHSLSTVAHEAAWDVPIAGIRLSIVSGRAIYVLAGSSPGPQALYAVELSSGRTLWRWNERSPVISDLCLSDSSLFYLTADGHLVVLTTLTGQQVARLAFTNAPFVLHRDRPALVQYQLAADPGNEVLAIAFSDNHQLMALKLLGGQEVFIEKPLYR